jgi:quercetin dioxygenase-like cupin family protein
MTTRVTDVAGIVDPGTVETFDLFGPTVQFFTHPDGEGEPLVLRGTIPPGAVVPMHSHGDPETFYLISGEVEGLVHSSAGYRWVSVGPGDTFHVPNDAKHAWRNRSSEPVVNFIITTEKMGRFFREVGTPIAPGAGSAELPSDEAMQHFIETSERYGYWNATPDENAEIGLTL